MLGEMVWNWSVCFFIMRMILWCRWSLWNGVILVWIFIREFMIFFFIMRNRFKCLGLNGCVNDYMWKRSMIVVWSWCYWCWIGMVLLRVCFIFLMCKLRYYFLKYFMMKNGLLLRNWEIRRSCWCWLIMLNVRWIVRCFCMSILELV